MNASSYPFQLKEFEGKETAQLVDRYKFLDLYPCSTVELKSIGYSDVGAAALHYYCLPIDSMKPNHD